MYFIDKTNRGYTRSNNRHADFVQLEKEAKTNPDPAARKLAAESMAQLKKESKPIKDMRESLIRAHRHGNTTEVKDIHDYIAKKRKYHNE